MTAIRQWTRVLSISFRQTPAIGSRCARLSQEIYTSSRRCYSAAAAEATNSTATSVPPNGPPPQTSPPAEASTTPSHFIKAGIILTRPPLLTRELTPFENAFFFYQKRLAARLTLPFSAKAWFKEDTPSQLDFALKMRERRGNPGRELGDYNGRAARAWDDELLVGDELSKPETLVEGLLEDSVMRVSEDAEEIVEEERVPAEKPMPRRTEADEKNNQKALDRWLDKTLYLVVKEKDGKWVFPAAKVSTSEALHATAQRVLTESAGQNMNTWIVGRVPVAHMVKKPVLNEDGTEAERGEKTFFLKGRIMAGQANLDGNRFGLQDFKWLTREELQKDMEPEYFHSVRNMMAER